MTFTYTEDLDNDRDYVRYWTGDVIEARSFLSDEIIASVLGTRDTRDEAVIAAFDHIIIRLAQPNFEADWLTVNYATAREGYIKAKAMFVRKSQGGVLLRSVATYQFRADSGQTEEADYTDGRP